MKKLLSLAVLCAILCSCGHKIYSGLYTYGLSKVESPKLKSERYGDVKSEGEDEVSKYSYEDDYIRISWLVSNKQFDFRLYNKTEHSIKIIWDDAAYVDLNGSAMRVIHKGVKFVEKNNPQPPTVIASGSYVDELVLPAENVYMNNVYAGWQTDALVPMYSRNKELLLSTAQSYIGKQLKVILPIQIEDITNDYEFTFDIQDFTPGWTD